jgi:flagella basal body P-ring formation protein FlgA
MKACLSAILCLLLFAGVAAAAEPGGISFRERAGVLGAEMTLGELAELSGEGAALADVPMGRSPEPGRTLAIERAELLNRLAVAVPHRLEVKCPAKVVAERRCQIVSRAQMIEALKGQLEQRLSAEGGQVSVTGFKVAEEPAVPEGKLTLLFDLSGANDRLLGTISLPLSIKVGEGVARKLRTAAQVTLCREVVCAAKAINRHALLGEGDVTLSRREMKSGLEPLTSCTEAIGKRADHKIEAGVTIARRDLEEPPALVRGAAVTILLESGLLTMVTRGQACEPGRVGDRIRVRNIDSKREVLAVVVDGSTVQVPF